MPSVVYPFAFYTYGLFDPKTGVMFYAGKGQKDRAWHHAREVAAGRSTGNARKDAKIAEILMRGDQVEIQILGEYDDENDALEHEFEVVDSMPELTNIRPGGEGRRLRPEEVARRTEARRNRIIDRMMLNATKNAQAKLQYRSNELRRLPGAKFFEAAILEWEFQNNVDQASRLHAVLRNPKKRKGGNLSRSDFKVVKPGRPEKGLEDRRKVMLEQAQAQDKALRQAEKERREAYLASLSPRQREIVLRGR